MERNNHLKSRRPRRRLSTSQIVCIVLLWFFLIYILLTNSPRIDGPLIVIILMSGAFVGIPVYKELKRRKEE
nr:hypothetical protein [Porphyromonas cangingivalis]